jgi:hypothetical protein
MQRLSCVLLIALAACSSPKAAQTMPMAAADGPTCAAAADHTMDLLSKGAPDARPGLVKSIRDTLVSHCEKDEWSAATRTCFAQVASKEDAQTCETSLSEVQRQALDKEHVGGGDAGGAAAPAPSAAMPPPPPSSGSRGATTKNKPKKGGDPEDGGE